MTWAANGRWLDSAVIALLLAAGVSLHADFFRNANAVPGSQPIVVLFPPWIGTDVAMRRVAQTGARIVGLGALPFIVIVEPQQEPDFAERATAAGALLTIDAIPFLACFDPGAAT